MFHSVCFSLGSRKTLFVPETGLPDRSGHETGRITKVGTKQGFVVWRRGYEGRATIRVPSQPKPGPPNPLSEWKPPGFKPGGFPCGTDAKPDGFATGRLGYCFPARERYPSGPRLVRREDWRLLSRVWENQATLSFACDNNGDRAFVAPSPREGTEDASPHQADAHLVAGRRSGLFSGPPRDSPAEGRIWCWKQEKSGSGSGL